MRQVVLHMTESKTRPYMVWSRHEDARQAKKAFKKQTKKKRDVAGYEIHLESVHLYA